jgi:hypothetical protein
MTRELLLPGEDRRLVTFTLDDPPAWPTTASPLSSRIAYAAAHVVADPLGDDDAAIDWDATLAYRTMLWSYGFGVAEAMDTAQRGMGLDWNAARELIRRSVAEARAAKGTIACGAGTDQLAAGVAYGIESVIHAYEEQCEFVEGCGGRIILMASRALAGCALTGGAGGAEDYRRVYGRILDQVAQPVILHWLGDMFDPALAGYWGYADPREATEACLELIREYQAKIDGIKISLLDASLEIEMRRKLPPGVRMYTGDDFGYAELIAGDAEGHSDALLGIFDAIAPAASAALQALDREDLAEYNRVLLPTVPLSRTIFETPTYNYKTGIVFLAWLNGYQRHFRMLGGKESARSVRHLSRVLMRATEAGLLLDPDLACQRMRLFLAQAGVE